MLQDQSCSSELVIPLFIVKCVMSEQRPMASAVMRVSETKTRRAWHTLLKLGCTLISVHTWECRQRCTLLKSRTLSRLPRKLQCSAGWWLLLYCCWHTQLNRHDHQQERDQFEVDIVYVQSVRNRHFRRHIKHFHAAAASSSGRYPTSFRHLLWLMLLLSR